MKNIAFASNNDARNINKHTPWSGPKKAVFQDLLIREEYMDRIMKIPVGKTLMRLVPAFESSSFGWLLGIYALNYKNGRFAHPKTLNPESCSVFDIAYKWALENAPKGLYSKENRAGIRLFPDPYAVFWAFLEVEGRAVARLVVASGFCASRGGVQGLGYQIWQLTREKNEAGTLICDPIDPAAGAMIIVEKTLPKGSKYPLYNVKRDCQPSPIADWLAKMDDSEIRALTPLENVIRTIDEEQQWQFLEKVVDPTWVKKIRESLNR